MADEKHRMKEHPLNWMNAWIVSAALVCVAASICYAIREYDLRSRELAGAINAHTAVMKSQDLRRFYEEKLAAYSKATEAASKIAALKSAGAPAAQVQDAVTQFKTLLRGPVSIAEGRDVNSAMDLFNGALDADADAGQVQQLALDLAHVCANEARDVLPAAAQTEGGAGYGPSSAILGHMRQIARVPESQQAAAQWLALVDAGQYAESWKTASGYFQSTFAQEQWERKIGGLRKALGGMVSRKFASADYAKPAQDAPEGERMILLFNTSFANKSDAVETVTTMLDKDGQWKVSAYSVK